MAQTMQKSVLGRPTAPVAQRRPTVQRPARIVALAQPFSGRPRAAPKAGSLQIAQAVALREVDTVQKLQEEDADVAINAIRFLAIDGVNAANSGHPGLPMGCASACTVQAGCWQSFAITPYLCWPPMHKTHIDGGPGCALLSRRG